MLKLLLYTTLTNNSNCFGHDLVFILMTTSTRRFYHLMKCWMTDGRQKIRFNKTYLVLILKKNTGLKRNLNMPVTAFCK